MTRPFDLLLIESGSLSDEARRRGRALDAGAVALLLESGAVATESVPTGDGARERLTALTEGGDAEWIALATLDNGLAGAIREAEESGVRVRLLTLPEWRMCDAILEAWELQSVETAFCAPIYLDWTPTGA